MSPVTHSRLSLGDLLAHDAFALELLSGEPDAPQRPVLGAHVVEVDTPARWLARDWVMLTTGVRLRGNAEAQRALVPELERAGVTALGFGVGLVFKRVPPALVDAAADRSFPIFAVPYETPFRELIHFVDSSLTMSEVALFRRLTSLQRYLIDALRSPDPERATVERLARFLDAGVVVIDAAGEPAIAAGRAPAEEIGDELRATSPTGVVELDVADGQAVAAPIASPGEEPTRWLAIACRSPRTLDRLAKPAAEATAPLLAAMTRLGDVVRDQEQAVKGALLEEALEPVAERALPPLEARAAAFGLDFSLPARLVVIRASDLARVSHALVARLEHAGVPHLVNRRRASLAALVQGPDEELRAIVAALVAQYPSIVVGVGRPVSLIGDVHHSLRDAELAADRAALSPERRVLQFEDFDVGTFVVSEIAPERLRPKLDELLGVLAPNAALNEAVVAYFRHDLDIVAAARELHLHPNSLRYRLSRVEQLLGRSLRQPSTITALYIALIAGS